MEIESEVDAFRAEMRLRRASIRLHELPARVSYELLCEIAIRYGAPMPEVAELAEQYATLNPDVLAALGGNRFPQSIRIVAA